MTDLLFLWLKWHNTGEIYAPCHIVLSVSTSLWVRVRVRVRVDRHVHAVLFWKQIYQYYSENKHVSIILLFSRNHFYPLGHHDKTQQPLTITILLRCQDQHNTIQYSTILYNTIQYQQQYNATSITIQYITLQCNTNTMQYNTQPDSTLHYNTTQYNTIQYNTIHNQTVQYITMQYQYQYNTIQCSR